MHSLINGWKRVQDDEGQVALVFGEAGIGKSRLVQRFHKQIAATPHTWIAEARVRDKLARFGKKAIHLDLLCSVWY